MLSISTSSSHGGDGSGNWTRAACIQAMFANHYTTMAHTIDHTINDWYIKLYGHWLVLLQTMVPVITYWFNQSKTYRVGSYGWG